MKTKHTAKREHIEFSDSEIRIILKREKDIKEGKNVFIAKSAEDFIKQLRED